jgi:hypothetical protein
MQAMVHEQPLGNYRVNFSSKKCDYGPANSTSYRVGHDDKRSRSVLAETSAVSGHRNIDPSGAGGPRRSPHGDSPNLASALGLSCPAHRAFPRRAEPSPIERAFRPRRVRLGSAAPITPEQLKAARQLLGGRAPGVSFTVSTVI